MRNDAVFVWIYDVIITENTHIHHITGFIIVA